MKAEGLNTKSDRTVVLQKAILLIEGLFFFSQKEGFVINGREFSARLPKWLGLEHLFCAGRLRDQGLFSWGREGCSGT